MKKGSRKKRYLCDRISKWFHKYRKIVFLLFFLTYFGSCILFSAFLLTEYSGFLTNYPESEYEYLNNVIDSIWNENTKEFDFEKAPNDVIIHSIEKNGDNITFKCQTLRKSYIIIPTVFVETSDDISKTFLNRNEYLNKIKYYVISISNMFILIIELLCWIILLLIIFVFWIISYLHKFIVKIIKHF